MSRIVDVEGNIKIYVPKHFNVQAVVVWIIKDVYFNLNKVSHDLLKTTYLTTIIKNMGQR